MRLKHYITEEYYKRFSNKGKSYEVFKNPSLKELRILSIQTNTSSVQDVRFIADNVTKDVYAWQWYAINHDNMIKKHLKRELKGRQILSPSMFLGTSDSKGNITSNDTLAYSNDVNYIEEIMDINWDWAKLFKISKYLRDNDYNEIQTLY